MRALAHLAYAQISILLQLKYFIYNYGSICLNIIQSLGRDKDHIETGMTLANYNTDGSHWQNP